MATLKYQYFQRDFQRSSELEKVYEGRVQVLEDTQSSLETLWFEHNRDGRPLNQKIRSMSVGDVVVLVLDNGEQEIWEAGLVGWVKLDSLHASEGTVLDYYLRGLTS